MALTDKQLALRQQSIGASDVSSILGISPWSSAADVYIQKTQQLEPFENAAMEAGHMLEPVVVDWALVKLGFDDFTWSSSNVRRTKSLAKVGDSIGLEIPAHANLDFMFFRNVDGKEQRCGLEAKTTGMGKYWGEENTDQVPDYIMVQCLWQALVADLDIIHIGVLIGEHGFKLKLYTINPLELKEETEEIVSRVSKFWHENVMEGVPPKDTLPNLDTLKKIIRVPNKTVDISKSIVTSWLVAKEELVIATAKERGLKKTLLNEMGDAELGSCELGTLTYYNYDRKGYTVNPSKYRSAKWKIKE